jgi:hypothetical protein
MDIHLIFYVQIFCRKPDDKRLVGRSRRRCRGNTEVDLKKIWREDVFWIHLAQDWAGSCEQGNKPLELVVHSFLHVIWHQNVINTNT